MILNQSVNDLPQYVCHAVSNNSSDEIIRTYFPYEKRRQLERYFSKKWVLTNNGYKEITVPIKWKALVKFLHISYDLERWQCMFPWDEDDFYDGYSQVKYNSDNPEPDYQGFIDENYITVFVSFLNGGIGVLIDRNTYDINFYCIGEDDGYWFIDIKDGWIKNERNYLKMFLMSLINELKIPRFDNQKVIEKLWKSKMEMESDYK